MTHDNGVVAPLWLGKALLVMVVVAALLNGSVYWLKRVGWLDGDVYQAVQAEFERWKSGTMHEILDEDMKGKTYLEFKVSAQDEFYSVDGAQKITKFAKEMVIALLLLVSLSIVVFFKQYKCLPRDIVAISLLGMVLLMGVVSWFENGLLVSLAGFYSFIFLFIALLGGWLARSAYLGFFAKCLFLLALVQLLLAPFELALGFDAFTGGSKLGDRLVGTHLQPSTAGIIAAVTMVFAGKWSSQFISRAIVFVTGALVFFSGSGAAMFLFLLGLIMLYPDRVPGAKWLGTTLSATICIAGGLILFPVLAHREIYASLFQRYRIFQEYFESGLGITQYLFGQGLGAATNSALRLAGYSDATRDLSYPFIFSADSTVTMLVAQVGIVGCLLFYAMLFNAARRDAKSRVVYIVIILASITINIPEVYPVNVLLGVLLAHSFMLKRNKLNYDALRVLT